MKKAISVICLLLCLAALIYISCLRISQFRFDPLPTAAPHSCQTFRTVPVQSKINLP